MRMCFFILAFLPFSLWSQRDSLPDFEAADPKYREDQFYLSLTYNIWQQRPEGIRQNKFSPGFSIGFLRDMPLNEKRTWAIAAGLGYAFHNFSHNIFMSRSGNDIVYDILDDDTTVDRNKISFHFVELPLELRWRTSTPDNHKFWRIYTGVKLSYLFANRYKFENGDSSFIIRNNKDVSRWQYGAYIATGYNTWNLHLYYSLSPLFDGARLPGGTELDMQTLNVGLMFYIL